MQIGLDIGSTTIKCVVLDEQGKIIDKLYERHFSHIVEKSTALLEHLHSHVLAGRPARLAVSGSAGMGLAQVGGVPFVQEVHAARIAAKQLSPEADVLIELGGEDAKILFLTGGVEVRMNGSCAGGTGAFIDQMAALLGLTPAEMSEAALKAEKQYAIASRCGVFAKSDVQPLINQGARVNDIASGIFAAVVNQTIAGLAQGRAIEGRIVYLGGPLSFLPALRAAFDSALNTKGVCPENSLYYVAMGAALYAQQPMQLNETVKALRSHSAQHAYDSSPPLFESREEYERFCARHARACVARAMPSQAPQTAYLGIDAGSTTVKLAAIGTCGELLHTAYQPNSGSPVPIIRQMLTELYALWPQLRVVRACATGYGEELVRAAFGVDSGVVETVAHFMAAKHFMPQVDFVIDIGGQDMKCFRVTDGAISDIFLNEACSAGCGSFLQAFAEAMGKTTQEFSQLGLFAKNPVNLGSRCTVFMNSSVKQAQKDGASTQSISAGLSISVVKNALYKVIRAVDPTDLGKHIVVQGGTFYNDAVLRAFEREMGVEVVRPDIAGLMGAYGAALYAKQYAEKHGGTSSLLTADALNTMSYNTKQTRCGLCENRCSLTVSTFSGAGSHISGNRCQRPVRRNAASSELNLYEYKRALLRGYQPTPNPKRGVVGLPMVLNMYELLPFWHTLFTRLGFSVITSGESSRELYYEGQGSIPSDTVCYPAKLVHGHIHRLVQLRPDAVFYPCMTYHIDEGAADNCYNCPIVAYYPEVIDANCRLPKEILFLNDYIGIHRPRDFAKKLTPILRRLWPRLTASEVAAAVGAAYDEYAAHQERVRERAAYIMRTARAEGRRMFVLAGRPYHIDPEVSHGLDRLICSYGVAVLTEDSIAHLAGRVDTKVLNQWTYHARLYAAATYLAGQKDMELVQLVSFGCGVDAITTDEVRELLQQHGKLYTQLKIDEIANLGAASIRLRSLLAALEARA